MEWKVNSEQRGGTKGEYHLVAGPSSLRKLAEAEQLVSGRSG
jgi:hypothetical protein